MTRAALILTRDDIRAKAADWCRRLPHGTRVRPVHVDGDVAFVALTKGHVAIIDAADAPRVEGVNWCALVSPRRHAVYAFRIQQSNGVQKSILMHRHIMSAADGVFVDHIDGDGTNNCRSNLRLCTFAENVRNQGARKDSSSGVRGVSWDRKAGKFKAEIYLNGRTKFLGYFDSIEAAKVVRNAAAAQHFGKFARLA